MDSGINDTIHDCINCMPPGLKEVFYIFKMIWNIVKETKYMQEQLVTLSGALAHLLRTLGDRRHGRLGFEETDREMTELKRLLQDVWDFVDARSTAGFLKSLFNRNDNTQAVKLFHIRIDMAFRAFHTSAILDIQDWLVKNDTACSNDQKKHYDRLTVLERDDNQLVEALGAPHWSDVAVMISLQQNLQNKSISDKREEKFIRHSLHYLRSTSRQEPRIDWWTISPVDVDFGELLGSGGFGEVYQGTWKMTQVALKVLKSQEGGIVPSYEMIHKEIETWSKLRHPNILQFLGANIVGKPFIVMPLLKNGNAWSFVVANPACDRVKILRDVSLGLVHLHSQHIIHGDLKARNVLIDDSGHNALLCDFGLSESKADVLSRSTTGKVATPAGSPFWMAPERFSGVLRKPVDVYAFGMTIYEIMAMETPLAHLPPMYFIDLVVERNVRPERPKEDGVKCQGFSDGLWSIAECCWVKEPNRRPNANNLCDNMERCLAAHRESKVTSSPLPLLSGLPPGSSTWGAQVNSSPQPILQSGDHPTQKAPERLSRSSSQRSQQGSSPTSDPPFRHADANRILLNSSAGSTKQSPPPAITQQRSLWGNPSKRPLTIEQLKARAEDQLWGEKEDVGHSLKSVTRFHTDGKLFQEQGDIESAYVQFAKAETLALEKIPRDKTYLAPEGQRRVLDKNGKLCREKREELEKAQLDRLSKWEESTKYLQVRGTRNRTL